jgi:hypothetical protein
METKRKRNSGNRFAISLIGALLLLGSCMPPAPQPPPVLFVTDYQGGNVLTFKNLVGVTGNVIPDNNLIGSQTALSQPLDVGVNAAGQLLVCNYKGSAITIYNDALNTNGNLAPVRTVKGAATEISGPTSLSVDRARDVVYVLNTGAGKVSILVFRQHRVHYRPAKHRDIPGRQDQYPRWHVPRRSNDQGRKYPTKQAGADVPAGEVAGQGIGTERARRMTRTTFLRSAMTCNRNERRISGC